ncbi:MAG: hypothetical protein ACLTKI_07810 [Lachnospiraceae bacterium]
MYAEGSLLQYMKYTKMDNPEITVRDDRICTLDEVVQDVKQSEEWEAVKMSILSIGIERGRKEILLEQIEKKLSKGKSIEVIAAELELEPPEVEKLMEENSL